MFLSLKNGASQGAQEDTPRPINFCSLGNPSHVVWAPVAIITDLALYSLFPTHAENSPTFLKATFSTSSSTIFAPNLSACLRILSMSFGPMIPSGNPGKFSTSVVNINCPPQEVPPITTVERAARVV